MRKANMSFPEFYDNKIIGESKLSMDHPIIFKEKIRAMTLCFIMLTSLILTSCSGNNFKYDRKNACVINYGGEGIAVIVDKDKVLVKNTSQFNFGKLLTISTADGTYSTLGRYFGEQESKAIVKSLSKSRVIYLRWISTGGIDASNNRSATINVSDFAEKFEGCVERQSGLR